MKHPQLLSTLLLLAAALPLRAESERAALRPPCRAIAPQQELATQFAAGHCVQGGVDGFVGHVPGRIIRVSPTQSERSLLRRPAGAQQDQHLGPQRGTGAQLARPARPLPQPDRSLLGGGRIVAGRLARPADQRAAVAWATAVAAQFPGDGALRPLQFPGDLAGAQALAHPGLDRAAFFRAQVGVVVSHVHGLWGVMHLRLETANQRKALPCSRIKSH